MQRTRSVGLIGKRTRTLISLVRRQTICRVLQDNSNWATTKTLASNPKHSQSCCRRHSTEIVIQTSNHTARPCRCQMNMIKFHLFWQHRNMKMMGQITNNKYCACRRKWRWKSTTSRQQQITIQDALLSTNLTPKSKTSLTLIRFI